MPGSNAYRTNHTYMQECKQWSTEQSKASIMLLFLSPSLIASSLRSRALLYPTLSGLFLQNGVRLVWAH